MSGYNGRRGPNVSQYLANLNTVASSPEQSTEPQPIDDDFSLFMNADFLDSFADNPVDVDLDLGPPLDFAIEVDPRITGQDAANPAAAPASTGAVNSKMDFGLNGDFQFVDFSNFNTAIVDPTIQNLPHSQAGAYPPMGSTAYASPSSAVSPSLSGFDAATAAAAAGGHDDAARNAAEEDKRRRNTAASARFRIKKKQREQVLEKTAKEMTDRVGVLETRISQLETENAWLKGLITEKNGGKASTSELRAMLTRHEEGGAAGQRSTSSRSDGVGTKKEAAKA